MKPRDLANPRWIYRSWYYFRLGYSTHLTFLLGYVSTLVTVYYLAIKNIPSLLDVFPHFLGFAVLATILGVPLAVIVQLRILRKLSETEGLLGVSDKTEIEELENKMTLLLKGGYLGSPKRQLKF